ncbi:hypothetical protein KDX38_23135 [Pseudomonas sp. CDFA 602]|uniref:hypothetical protein n=1 Tax=Pseudomonas californiensis TaxID=2829823 RepID=UPI001E5C7417|nr:hypothetical protein [Pseudomonas californiensis]MCD5996487.1 hypothetical protein [Pseudomonas californiensis]MCD6002086.1 hypothetical protein [Pseudomonas californiensis]
MSSLHISKLHVDDLAEPWASYGKRYDLKDGFVWVVFHGDRIHGVFPSEELAKGFLHHLQHHLDNGDVPPHQTKEQAQSIAVDRKKQAEKAARKSQSNTPSDSSPNP